MIIFVSIRILLGFLIPVLATGKQPLLSQTILLVTLFIMVTFFLVMFPSNIGRISIKIVSKTKVWLLSVIPLNILKVIRYFIGVCFPSKTEDKKYYANSKKIARFSSVKSRGLKTSTFNSLTVTRNFSTSPRFYIQDDPDNNPDTTDNNPHSPDLERDANNTSEQSPIESDVEESSAQLAEEFKHRPTQLIDRQTEKMSVLSEKSQTYLKEIMEDRAKERAEVPDDELENFDRQTKEIVQDEGEMFERDINTIARIRDDALDLLDNTKLENSDYDSDYESQTSQDKYNHLDNSDRNFKDDHNRFIQSILGTVADTDSNAEEFSDNSGENSDDESSDINIDPPVEAGPSNYWEETPVIETGHSSKRKRDDSEDESSHKRKRDDSEDEISLKRKREDSEDESSHKKPKLEDFKDSPKDVDSDNNQSQDKRSPLDYVLDKQQSEPYDFTDDLD